MRIISMKHRYQTISSLYIVLLKSVLKSMVHIQHIIKLKKDILIIGFTKPLRFPCYFFINLLNQLNWHCFIFCYCDTANQILITRRIAILDNFTRHRSLLTLIYQKRIAY